VLLKKKPVDDTKLTFAKMGAKPTKPVAKQEVAKKKKKGPGLSFYSKKAAAALVKGE
jgi:hypothetical protein